MNDFIRASQNQVQRSPPLTEWAAVKRGDQNQCLHTGWDDKSFISPPCSYRRGYGSLPKDWHFVSDARLGKFCQNVSLWFGLAVRF